MLEIKQLLFLFRNFGFNVDCINTITLSNEPGYAGGFKGQTMSGVDLGALVEGLEGNDLLNHDVIITGYTRTRELLNQIENTVKKVKLNNVHL
jgi:pyridoxal/pyridoxine/pyridoxamine kinase